MHRPLVLALAVAAFGLFGSLPARADGAACFPACRSGFVCSPEGKCVSPCNPPCDGGQVCSSGECLAKKHSSSEAESSHENAEKGEARTPIPERSFELGLGLGYQRVGSLDYFSPALAFRYVLALGLEPHLLLGVRAAAALGPSTQAEFGLDLGYRHRLGAIDAPVRGGFFVTLRPELWPAAGGSGKNAFVGGGSLGPFIELERLVLSLPLAGGAGKILAHSGSFAYFSASVEAAIRF